jgi:hypothetical protein
MTVLYSHRVCMKRGPADSTIVLVPDLKYYNHYVSYTLDTQLFAVLVSSRHLAIYHSDGPNNLRG